MDILHIKNVAIFGKINYNITKPNPQSKMNSHMEATNIVDK